MTCASLLSASSSERKVLLDINILLYHLCSILLDHFFLLFGSCVLVHDHGRNNNVISCLFFNHSNAKGSNLGSGLIDLRQISIPSPSSGPNPEGGFRVVHRLWYANLFVLLKYSCGQVSPNTFFEFSQLEIAGLAIKLKVLVALYHF